MERVESMGKGLPCGLRDPCGECDLRHLLGAVALFPGGQLRVNVSVAVTQAFDPADVAAHVVAALGNMCLMVKLCAAHEEMLYAAQVVSRVGESLHVSRRTHAEHADNSGSGLDVHLRVDGVTSGTGGALVVDDEARDSGARGVGDLVRLVCALRGDWAPPQSLRVTLYCRGITMRPGALAAVVRAACSSGAVRVEVYVRHVSTRGMHALCTDRVDATEAVCDGMRAALCGPVVDTFVFAADPRFFVVRASAVAEAMTAARATAGGVDVHAPSTLSLCPLNVLSPHEWADLVCEVLRVPGLCCAKLVAVPTNAPRACVVLRVGRTPLRAHAALGPWTVHIGRLRYGDVLGSACRRVHAQLYAAVVRVVVDDPRLAVECLRVEAGAGDTHDAVADSAAHDAVAALCALLARLVLPCAPASVGGATWGGGDSTPRPAPRLPLAECTVDIVYARAVLQALERRWAAAGDVDVAVAGVCMLRFAGAVRTPSDVLRAADACTVLRLIERAPGLSSLQLGHARPCFYDRVRTMLSGVRCARAPPPSLHAALSIAHETVENNTATLEVVCRRAPVAIHRCTVRSRVFVADIDNAEE